MPIFKPLSIFLFLSTLFIIWGGSQRLSERVASVRSIDDTHFHQVYKNNILQEQFVSRSASLSAIGISTSSKNISNDTSVTITVIDVDSNTTISKQDIRASNLGYISIPLQRQSMGKIYVVVLDASSISKQHALYIPYQSDPTKDPTSIVTQAGERKQGSLGLTEYETPTYALVAARWLLLQHQYPLWVGVILIGVWFRFRKKITIPPITVKPLTAYLPYMLAILVACLVVYWPATHLFFYSDDVPILARIHELWHTNPLLILTPHRYIDPDPVSQFGFDFYRPISFSLYPLLLYLAIPTTASVYYFCNLLLFVGTGWCLFLIASHTLKSKQHALLAVAIWAMGSTKLGLLYWWSSSQDLLASLFATLSMALYIRGRNRLSLIAFGIALFSKEYVITTPIILFLLTKGTLREKTSRLLPYIGVIGIFLIINTAMLGDPSLPPHKHTDQTYSLSLSPQSIARNIVIYTSASVENRVWPRIPTIENPLDSALRLWEAKTAGPYYPGLVVIIFIGCTLILFWKYRSLQRKIILSIVWWVVFLGPILLFANDWKVRWLSLSLFGLGLYISSLVKHLNTKIIPIIGCVIVVVYGYTVARDPQLTRFYREQSTYTQMAYIQLKAQEQEVQDEQRVILVGITEDQKTSLNAYLFRVFAKNPHAEITYADSTPSTRLPGDIIIVMTGISPYYPESEK